MDKQTFYSQLSGKLTELGVGEEYINRHLTQFDSFFSGKSDEEVSMEIAKLGSIDRVAARIKRITDKMIADEAKPTAAESNTPHHSEAAAEHDPEEESPPVKTGSNNADIGSEPGTPPTTDKAQIDGAGNDDDSVASEIKSPRAQMPEAVEQSIGAADVRSIDASGSIGYSVPDDETLRRNTQKFRIIAIATLPLSLAILLAIAFLFGAAFFGIAVLIIGAIGLLIAMTAAGTLASVFGLIFGVAQMVSSMPIGLYECGLSIIIGSSVLFCGILVYNFAVRLMPYAAKWLLIFAKYVVKKLKELYIYLKKECIGI